MTPASSHGGDARGDSKRAQPEGSSVLLSLRLKERGWEPADAYDETHRAPSISHVLVHQCLVSKWPVVCILGMQVIACDVT